MKENLSLEEALSELGKTLRTSERRANVREYFELLEWAELFTNLPPDGAWTKGIGYEIGGVRYGLLFSKVEAASAVGSPDYIPKRIRVREMLERLEDGWGLIVDYGTDAEVRLSPDELTEENERIRIKPVRQEATVSWLYQLNEQLKREGISRNRRASAARKIWEKANGFRVLPDSRRSRRIDWYFDVVADATESEADERCDRHWRATYDTDRYLRHLNNDDLRARTFAIQTNLLFTDRGILPQELDEREWRELLAHTRYEHEKRGLPFSEPIPIAEQMAVWPRLDRARDAIRGYSGSKGHLFKFGDAKYLERLLHEGHVRILPAASYNDPSLLPAQRDNELEKTAILDGSMLWVTHTDSDKESRPIQATGKFTITSKSATNFYIWCMSTDLDPRLFDDFGANACLLIHDHNQFIDRMYAAMEAALPDWHCCTTLVHYYDPVRPEDTTLSPHDKEFSYAYQREYRFLWEPVSSDKAVQTLYPVELCLGSLTDIASLIKI